MPIGSPYASLQLILPDQARGQVGAMRVSALNLFGLILGPSLPGFFNDYLFKDYLFKNSLAARRKKTCVLRMTVVFLRAINFAWRRRRPYYSAHSERRS
jgi:hypothetical protein